MARMALPPSDLRQAIATRKESYTNLTSLDATSHGELHEVVRHIQPSCRTRRHTWFRERNSIAHISSHCTSTHARARTSTDATRRDEHHVRDRVQFRRKERIGATSRFYVRYDAHVHIDRVSGARGTEFLSRIATSAHGQKHLLRGDAPGRLTLTSFRSYRRRRAARRGAVTTIAENYRGPATRPSRTAKATANKRQLHPANSSLFAVSSNVYVRVPGNVLISRY